MGDEQKGRRPVAIPARDVPLRETPSVYPEPFASR